MSLRVATLDSHLQATEHAFNKVGYVPLLATITGLVRTVLGLIEIVASLASTIFMLLSAVFSKNTATRNHKVNQAFHAFQYAGHGCSNVFRGVIEAVPFVNLVCIKYDSAFRLCYRYETES